MDRLMPVDALRAARRATSVAAVEQRCRSCESLFRMDLPPVRKGKAGRARLRRGAVAHAQSVRAAASSSAAGGFATCGCSSITSTPAADAGSARAGARAASVSLAMEDPRTGAALHGLGVHLIGRSSR